MTKVYVIRNQHGHYLGKQNLWLDGSDRRLLFRTIHQDEAANVVFEQSSKDIYLRAEPLICEVDANNQPMVEAGPPTALESQVGDGNADTEATARSVMEPTAEGTEN